MKILFVTPPSILDRNVGPPLGLGYLASCLERNNHEVKIIDTLILNYTIDDIRRELKNFDPDIVGISGHSTPFFDNAYPIIKMVDEYIFVKNSLLYFFRKVPLYYYSDRGEYLLPL